MLDIFISKLLLMLLLQPVISTENSIVTVQLNASHVVRSWQPSSAADCLWSGPFPPRWSQATNRFPAAVRSQPRSWLVMQLRRPMLVERVSVQSWDGEWQTAGAVGSRVSAFGAASLPLELQLEDPCRANSHNFQRFRDWKAFDASRSQTVVSFILLRNTIENSSDFAFINISGRYPTLEVNEANTISIDDCHVNKLLVMKEESKVKMQLTDRSLPLLGVECFIDIMSGSKIKKGVRLHKSDSGTERTQTHYTLRLTAALNWHDALLTCCYSNTSDCPIKRSLGVIFIAKSTILTPPSLWVTGHNATVLFKSLDEYPVSEHSCKITRAGIVQQILTIVNQTHQVSKSRGGKGRIGLRSVSYFTFKVERSHVGTRIECNARLNSLSIVELFRSVDISEVSDSCVTEVDLGSSRYWKDGDIMKIRVTSRNCTTWNVAHKCWIDFNGAMSEKLNKISQDNFSSVHEIHVSRRMSHSDWSVRCRVNQSGFEYQDAVTHRDQQPKVFYTGEIEIKELNRSSGTERIWTVTTLSPGQPALSDVNCTTDTFPRLNQNDVSKDTKTFSYRVLPTIRVTCSCVQRWNEIVVYRHTKSLNLRIMGNFQSYQRSTLDSSSHWIWTILTSTTLIAILSSVTMTIVCVCFCYRRKPTVKDANSRQSKQPSRVTKNTPAPKVTWPNVSYGDDEGEYCQAETTLFDCQKMSMELRQYMNLHG